MLSFCKKVGKTWIYVVFGAKITDKKQRATDPGIKEGKWFEKQMFLHMGSDSLVHPDMQLVYGVAVDDRGLPIESVKYINYDIQ